MAETKSAWSFVEISPEAREAAERAAAAAGMDLDAWLAQLVKYTSAMELKAQPAAPRAAAPARPLAAAPAAQPISARPPPAAPTLNLSIGPSRHATGQDLPPNGPRHDPPPLFPPPSPSRAPERHWGRAPDRTPTPTAERAPLPIAPAPAAPVHAPLRAPEPRAAAPRKPEPGDPPSRGAAHGFERAPAAERPTELPPDRAAIPAAFTLPAPPPRPTVTMPQRPGSGAAAAGLSLRPAMAAEESHPFPIGFAEPEAPPPLRLPLRAAPRPVPERIRDRSVERAPDRTTERGSDRVAERAAERPPESAPPPPGEQPRMIATDMLQPSRFAALASPKEDDIQAALDRWRASGMLEPLIARSRAGGQGAFEIISGIDRWHAARRAYVRQIPVLVREMGDQEALEQGLVDQLRRGPLSPLAEANIYLRLLNDAGLDTDRAARLAGKQPSHVATMVRILNLPKAVRAMLEKGEITVMHARALLDAPNPDAIARDIIERRLDIYQTEQLVRIAGRNAEMVDMSALLDAPSDESIEELGTAPFAREPRQMAAAPRQAETAAAPPAEPRAEPRGEDARPPAPSARRPSDTRAPREGDVISTELLERNIANALGVRCAISEKNGVGVISLHYTSREELVRILSRINSGSASG